MISNLPTYSRSSCLPLTMSKEPNRYQLSSRLSYNAQTPAFLRRLQKQVAGEQDSDDEQEFEDDGSGRPPIPRRPAIPQRPDDDPGSADEDDLDEKPQIVVLREGKHLSERDVENEKRKGGYIVVSLDRDLLSIVRVYSEGFTSIA